MQQVARYLDYNNHQSTRAQLTTGGPLYEVPSPVSVESPPGSEASTVGALVITASSNSYHYRQQQQQQQQQQQNLRKGSTVVTSSVSGMNLQPSPASLQQQQQQQNAGTSAVDYSNGTTNSGSNGRLEVVGGSSDNSSQSVCVSSYMPAYCLAPPSHTVTSSDVYQQQQQQQQHGGGVYQNQAGLQVDDSNLKLRMQQDPGSCAATTTVTTPEVISMLKNPDFDGVSTSTSNMLYGDDKVLDQVGLMRDLVKPTTSDQQQQQQQQQMKTFNMEVAHCSSGQPPQIFPQHLGSLQKDYFTIHDERVAGSGLPSVSGSTVHHMGHAGIADIHYPTLQMPGALQHNQMIGPIKSEPPQGMMGGSPPVSPIDMDHQEAIKSERKRMRNRIAAHKCRRRKLERISKLEDKVASLKNHNAELNNNINMLKQQVTDLKAKVLDHVNQGCEIIIDQRQLIM